MSTLLCPENYLNFYFYFLNELRNKINGMVKIRSCNSRAYSKNNSRRLDILVNEVSVLTSRLYPKFAVLASFVLASFVPASFVIPYFVLTSFVLPSPPFRRLTVPASIHRGRRGFGEMRTSAKFWGFSTKFDLNLDKNC